MNSSEKLPEDGIETWAVVKEIVVTSGVDETRVMGNEPAMPPIETESGPADVITGRKAILIVTISPPESSTDEGITLLTMGDTFTTASENMTDLLSYPLGLMVTS